MRKAPLIILWIIILGGSLFIAQSLIKPKLTTTDPGISIEKNEPEIVDETTPEPESTPIAVERPKTYSQYIQKGDNQILEYKIESALENYTQAVALNSDSLEPYLRLAKAYLLNNNPSEALTTFQKAQDIDPSSLEVKLGIIQSHLNLREIKAAKEIILSLNQANPNTQYYNAVTDLLYKDYNKARDQFEKIIKTEGYPNNLKEKSQIFLDAFEEFELYKEGEPLHQQALISKALVDVGQYQIAIPMLFEIIEESANYQDAWIMLGYSYLQTDQIPDAIDALSQAKDLDPNRPETLFFLGLAYFSNNDIPQAIALLEDAKKKGYRPKNELQAKLGELYIIEEEFQKSAKNFEEVLARNTNNMEIFVRAIWLNIDKIKDNKKAVQLATSALEAHPQDPMSYNLVGWALTSAGRYDDAEKYLRKALDMQPMFDAAYLNLGWLYEKQGATILAQEYYKKAFNIGQGNSIANLAAMRYNKLQIEVSKPIPNKRI